MSFEEVIIGPCTLYRGDSRDVLPSLRSASVDAVVTDAPYGIGAADWDADVPLWALPLIRDALIDGGACYWFGVSPNVWQVGLSGELDLRRELIWWHDTGYPGQRNYRLSTETVLFLTKGRPAYFDADSIREPYVVRPERPRGRPERQNPLGKSPGNVIRMARPAPRHEDESGHKHAKPVRLLSRFITASCPPGGVVCDPFMGHAATAIACLKTGRSFIGIDSNPASFDMACRRVRKAMEPARQLELV